MTTISFNYNGLTDFLCKHTVKDDKNVVDKIEITHTRIGNSELNIYGGKYSIFRDELPIFYKLYYEHIFINQRKEYLTEKQLENDGPILVDFDFRYDYETITRIHTTEHIQDIILLYLEILKDFFVFNNDDEFPIFIMEKPNINRDYKKQITKDGIHMIIGLQMDRTMQIMLREKVLQQIADIWELPLLNSYTEVLDEGISAGICNWQLYGSQKPGFESYQLTHYYIASFDNNNNEWKATSKNINEFDLSENFSLLSAQYNQHLKLNINSIIMNEYMTRKNAITKLKSKNKKTNVRKKLKITSNHSHIDENNMDNNMIIDTISSNNNNNLISLDEIINKDTLKQAIDNILSNLNSNEQYIKETHEFTQILPSKYYEPGSHVLNRKVAFALKNTDERLFLSWIMLRSKADDFDFETIPLLYETWNRHFNKNNDNLTRASIMYWAKNDAYEEYIKVKENTVDYYIEETIFEAGDWDYAMVLHHMFKDKYVCTDISKKIFYVYNEHRWEKDEGCTLRYKISSDLYQAYARKQGSLLAEAQNYPTGDERHDKIQRKVKKIAEILIKFKKTNDKNSILREAMEIFFDRNFIKNIDANPYLLCFTNGVYDFKLKEFRRGYPQDYITKSTKIEYKPYNYDEMKDIVNEINIFMEQLFPQPELCRYMWDHLASTLIGVKKEQSWNIYRGSGSNGKSLLTELMSQCLNDYKGSVPINYVTDKRGNIGSVSPELIKLKGIRYAVMQEPSKGMILNEGIMKELTSGDPLTARGLYCDSETFIPQATFAVCTNSLFEINSNDDGTWRRTKLVDFLAKFISPGEFFSEETPYLFPKDKSLRDKLPIWAPIFMSMLVKRALETDGEVIDCPQVVASSNKYRESQDAINKFIKEMLYPCENKDGVSKLVLNDHFKIWFGANYGNKKPKLDELIEGIEKIYGSKKKGSKWFNFKIRDETNNDDDNDDDIINDDDILDEDNMDIES